MFKLLHFKDLLGSRKHDVHLLMIDTEIRFFKNKDKVSVCYSYHNIKSSIKGLALILRIFAYKGSELNSSKQIYNLSFYIAITFNELPLGDM